MAPRRPDTMVARHLISFRDALFGLLNICGALAYLYCASEVWADPQLANIPGAGAGDPIIWGLSALPILLLFLMMNVLFLLWVLFSSVRRRKLRLSFVYAATPVAWVGILYIDYSHHWMM